MSISLMDPAFWGGLATLSVLEIVLGIDNVVFLALLVARLPESQRPRARQWGLIMAFVMRILLLTTLVWIIKLTQPIVTIYGIGLSWRDLVLIAGGIFLLYKATHEIHTEIEGDEDLEASERTARPGAFSAIILQIAAIDLVFSIDSIVTAVGIAEHLEVMIGAIVIAMLVMYFAATAVGHFIEAHPTTKMLALNFLLLIGMALIADGLHFHIPREYIYVAMAFSAFVEVFNVLAKRSRTRARAAERQLQDARKGQRSGT
jgi:predicted tellurium resistance membrane protein TerC